MSVTSQCLQKRLRGLALLGASGSTSTSTYFLLCKRGEEVAMGTVWGDQGRASQEKVRAAPPPQIYIFFSRFPTRARFDGCIAKRMEKRVMDRRRGGGGGQKPTQDHFLPAVEISSNRGRRGFFCHRQIKGTKEDSPPLCQPSSNHNPPQHGALSAEGCDPWEKEAGGQTGYFRDLNPAPSPGWWPRMGRMPQPPPG